MKLTILAASAVLSISSTLALAQAPTDAPATPPASPADAERRPEAPPAPPEDDRDEGASADTATSRSWRERAARFRIEAGGTVIDFRCAEGEPTKECADLLIQVLDRLRVERGDDNDRRSYGRDSDSDRDDFRPRSRDDFR
ncbi:hypothetical protein M0654_01885 [Rhizobium sp. NTR19]|uniref:Uncharacterized protein n=1 Tax=Neorhizobium turbinariae TaxID=2937795 RepID=A0ABT0ILJ7_9HYPH|nr:hypothetical protein [Neorhizobium turbinariae]MCK8778723.1 hypothetical protein [Neorhizobium turbinariae]